MREDFVAEIQGYLLAMRFIQSQYLIKIEMKFKLKQMIIILFYEIQISFNLKLLYKMWQMIIKH